MPFAFYTISALSLVIMILLRINSTTALIMSDMKFSDDVLMAVIYN